MWLAVAPAGLCKGPRPPGREAGLLELPLYPQGLQPWNLLKPLPCSCGLLEEGGRHFTVVTVSSWCPRVLIAGKPAAD